MEMLIAGNDEFLAACLDPGLQRILLTDAPAVGRLMRITYRVSIAPF